MNLYVQFQSISQEKYDFTCVKEERFEFGCHVSDYDICHPSRAMLIRVQERNSTLIRHILRSKYLLVVPILDLYTFEFSKTKLVKLFFLEMLFLSKLCHNKIMSFPIS